MNKKITQICGPSDITPDFEKIGNDPNFVFKPDSSFTSIQLYNADGESITVNSWLECANYVNGGWVNSIVEDSNLELYFFTTLLLLAASLVLKDIVRYFNFFNVKK